MVRAEPNPGVGLTAGLLVLFELLDYRKDKIIFETLSGPLYVSRGENGLLCMDFPAQSLEAAPEPEGLSEALGIQPVEVFKNDDIFAVFESEDDIASMKPDFNKLAKVKTRGICVTAPGKEADFVSRFFAPRLDINEDPVTGSSHCTLTPLWAEKLGQDKLTARQLSKRGGTIYCALEGGRVSLKGRAAPFMEAEITI